MIRYFLLALLFLLQLTYAAPVGNLAAPALLNEGLFIPDTSWSNPQFGILGDRLLNKRFRPCHASQTKMKKAFVQGSSSQGYMVWDLFERFSLQGNLGSGQFIWRWLQGGDVVSGKVSDGLLWNGDAKLVLLEIQETSFSIGGQYGGWDWMEGPVFLNGAPLNQKTNTKMRYWQVEAALSQKISPFSPYLGILISRYHINFSDLETGSSRLRSLHQFGFLGGCSLVSDSKILLNLEWRVWVETGLSLFAQIRF